MSGPSSIGLNSTDRGIRKQQSDLTKDERLSKTERAQPKLVKAWTGLWKSGKGISKALQLFFKKSLGGDEGGTKKITPVSRDKNQPHQKAPETIKSDDNRKKEAPVSVTSGVQAPAKAEPAGGVDLLAGLRYGGGGGSTPAKAELAGGVDLLAGLRDNG